MGFLYIGGTSRSLRVTSRTAACIRGLFNEHRASAMKVELPGESKPFADIEEGECFAFTRTQVTSVCMKVEWLSSASVAALWSASDDWTLPHLIAPTELAGSILHSLPSAVFVALAWEREPRKPLKGMTRAGWRSKAPLRKPMIGRSRRGGHA